MPFEFQQTSLKLCAILKNQLINFAFMTIELLKDMKDRLSVLRRFL